LCGTSSDTRSGRIENTGNFIEQRTVKYLQKRFVVDFEIKFAESKLQFVREKESMKARENSTEV